MTESTFQVDGMDCPSCEHRLGKALRNLDGVARAAANSRTGEVQVTFEGAPVPEALLVERIEQVGFRVAGREGPTP